MPISLTDTAQTAVKGISLDNVPTSNPTPDPVALAKQTDKYDYAMGTDSPGPQKISAYFFTGNQDNLRQQIYIQAKQQYQTYKTGVIQDTMRGSILQKGSLDANDYSTIRGLSQDQLKASSDTIVERLYAHRLSTEAMSGTGEADKGITPVSDPGTSYSTKIQPVQDYLTRQELAKKTLGDLQAKYAQANLFDKAYDFGSQFVPFLNNYVQTKDQVEGVNEDINSILDPGGHLAAEYRGLNTLPPEKFQQAFLDKVDALVKSGQTTQQAIQYVTGFLDYSGTDQAWAGINQIGDASILLAPLGKGIKVAQSLAKANVRPLGNVARLVVTGNSRAAARTLAFDQLVGSKLTMNPTLDVATKTPRPVAQVQGLLQSGYGLLDPKVYMRDPGQLSNEAAMRLRDSISNDQKFLLSTLDDAGHIVRINDDAFVQAAQKAEASAYKNYPQVSDMVIEAYPIRESEQVFGGVDRVDLLLGKKGTGELFKTAQAAETYAKKMARLPDGSYDVAQSGSSYVLRLSQTVDELDPSVRLKRITTDNRNPESLVNVALGRVRAADDVLSTAHNERRKVAAYGGSGVMRRLVSSLEPVGKLSTEGLNNLRDVVDAGRDRWRVVHSAAGPVRVKGKFFETAGELDSEYLTRFGRTANEGEHRAYAAVKSISELDHLQKNVSVLRDKARLGLDQKSFSISSKLPTGGKAYRGTDFFEGKTIDRLPETGGTDYGVMWVDPKTGEARYGLSSRLHKSHRDQIDKIISQDGKVIQVFDPHNEVLRGLEVAKGDPVEFVVVRDLKSKPLDDLQVPYLEGGSWNYPEGNVHIKQPVTYKSASQRRIYTGDKSAFSFTIPRLAKEVHSAMEEGRKMLVNGASEADVTSFVSKNLPFADDADWRAQFRNIPGGSDTGFDLNTPFVVTNAGQRATDVLKLEDVFSEPIIDSSVSPHSLQPHVKQYYGGRQGERLTVRNDGSEANPVYRMDTMQLVDFNSALERQVSTMARDRFFEDYKRTAVEDWVEQFSHTLDAPAGTVQANPMKFIMEPQWKQRGQIDVKTLAAAKQSRRSILQFLGQETPESKAWKAMRQTTVDAAYQTQGQRAAEIVDAHLWHTVDPTAIARSAVFHARLGLFNPGQLFQQASSVIHAYAIDGSPGRAARATFGYWAMRMKDIIPDHKWGPVAKMISKGLGMDVSVIDDMHASWKSSGIDKLGGEYGQIDDFLNPKLFQSAGRTVLDAGRVFFEEGNNLHRGVSYSLAYLQWREANPLARMSALDAQKIMNRADLMGINMTRASNSTLQQGLGAVPMQFMNYQNKLTEQLLGKRLTALEKTRVVAAYSLMWGVPVGVGGSVAGALWPMADSARQYMLEHGIDGDANLISQVVSKGLGSMLVDWLAGEKTDVGARYGPGGNTFIKKVVFDQNLAAAFGAGPNFIGGLVGSFSPLAHDLASVFNGDQTYHFNAQDFLEVLKNISTINNGTKAWAVVNAGEIQTASGEFVNVNSSWQTAAAVALGLSPQSLIDAYLEIQSHNDAKDGRNAIAREAQVLIRRALNAGAGGDQRGYLEWITRARDVFRTGGISPIEGWGILQNTMKDNKSLLDKIGYDFMKDSPDERAVQYRQQFEQQLKVKSNG